MEDHQETASNTLEEVVVTAQRREESLLEVPLAVTVLSGEVLERLGALDLSYLSQLTPNTSVEVSAGTNNSIAATIRGVGHQQHIAGFESGVGLYVDDVYYNRPQLSLLDIYDVERIEVLRGPQGTLYGRNTVGGAIKYVTRRLGKEPELRLRSRAGNYGMRDAIVGGTLPLGESLRIGASFASLNLDGFGENLYLRNEDNYNKEVQAARGSVEWEPAADWFLRIAGDWTQDDSDLRRGHRIFVGQFSGAPILENVFDTRAGNAFPEAEAESKGISLTAEWNANSALKFRGILASRQDETWKPVDLDGLPTVDVDVSTWDANRQKTAEFQALYSGERTDAVAGVFAIDASAGTVLGVVLGTTGDLIGRPGLGNELSGDVETRSWAAYADFTFAFNEAWSGSLGGRYTHDERSAFVGRRVLVGGTSGFFGGPAVPVATTSDFNGSEVFTRFTPRAAVQWRPGDEQHLYLSYSEGFKGGGFDPRGLSTQAPDFDGDGLVSENEVHEFMKFDPEEVASWELGW
ncbi:MAG: TonB-dependent receptor, partial [Xanthomonadales bacterium]|nr:TonB-dependent receptor [Xanthomonadales bacterium]